MNSKELQAKLKPHKTSRKEIHDMLAMIERDLESAQVSKLSHDWQFSIAYNAARICCLIPLYCTGYRVPTNVPGQHYLTIESLTFTMGSSYLKIKKYLNHCRMKRNKSDYDTAGLISPTDVKDLIQTANQLYKDVKNWLAINYPEYL